eukprot:15460583-Alexandrium_andersonii.AAC.1
MVDSTGRWKKLRLYEVLPFIGHPGNIGLERHLKSLNMPDSLGHKETVNQTPHALQQLCYPTKGASEIPCFAISKLIHLKWFGENFLAQSAMDEKAFAFT